ncbi:oligosaccharide flippase family protein [Eubacterium limosum]|uniref:oligosaccharide flippase family protein n=1 Tax=Eubacterium limosum TaxID=1736 RepID=UPI0010624ABA|nr:oligosaccharide flippase family protein [Eubacterium limosum]
MKKSSIGIGKDAVNLTISKILTMLIAMLSAMLLSRYRTLEEYGTYSQLLMVIQLAISIFTLGLPNSINFFLAKAESLEEKKRFLSNYYVFNTILCLVMGVFLYFSAPLITKYFKNEMIKNFVYVLAILPWANVIMSSIENILIVYKKTIKLMLFRITNSFCLLLIIAIAIAFKMSFENYMLLYVSIQTIYALSVYFIVNKLADNLYISFEKKLIRQILRFSIPLGLATMVGTISIELDKMLISAFFSTDQLAIYTNASKEMPVTIIASSLTAVLMPRLVKLLKYEKSKEAIKLWSDTTVFSYVFICFFSAVLFVFSPQIITFLYSEKYLPGINIFRVYSLVLLLRVTYFGIILNSIGKTKFIFYSSIASLFLNVIFNFAFLYLFGMIGPALATFLSVMIVGLAQIIYTANVTNIKVSKIMPWKTIGLITLVNIIIATSIFLIYATILNEYIINEYSLVVLLIILWTILYFVLYAKLLKTNGKI